MISNLAKFTKYKKIGLGGSLIMLLVACAKPGTSPTPPPSYVVDESQIELAETAVAVKMQLEEMALVTAAKADRVQIQRDEPIAHHYEMARLVSVNWSGPVEPLVKQLAASNDYRVEVFGQAPAVPVLVSLNKRDTSAGALLQDTMLQVQGRAQIFVFPDAKIVELHYVS